MRRIILLVGVLTAAWLSEIQAQEGVPTQFSYVGFITDAQDVVVADGQHELTFQLYGEADGGVSLWRETRTVTTVRGVFSAVLGQVETLDLPFDQAYWLGITVGDGQELSPRVPLAATPYSLFCQVSRRWRHHPG